MFYSFSLCVHLGSGAISSARVQWWWHAIIRISAAAVCGVRGNGWRRVGAGFVDAEGGRRRGARAEQLIPGERGVDGIGGFGVEGELGKAGPEAVPTGWSGQRVIDGGGDLDH